MKPTLKTFSLSPMRFKLHLHDDETKWNAFLNENIDTILGLHGEVLGEGLYFQEKHYKGNIRDDFFVAKSKHVISDFKTYNPWTIRGDFESVGSNIELELTVESSNSTRTQGQNTMLFTVLPLILVVGMLFKNNEDSSKLLVIMIASLIPVFYHLIQRWFQFTTLRHFIRKVQKEIEISVIPH